MNIKQIVSSVLWVFILFMTTVSNVGYATENSQTTKEDNLMKMRITAGETVLTATMDDNATSRDFMSLLPITLKMTNYASTEKVSDLPKKLSTQGAPPGCKAATSDITLYAPWGNLAIFYKDFGYAGGLVCMGKVDGSGADISKLSGNVQFERMD